MRAARRKPTLGTAQLVLLLAAGCSLQDFDYLQQSAGGSNAGGTSSSAGTSSAGTDSGEGGVGAEPSSAGNGGEAPGGADSGGADSGGTNVGGGGKGGSGGSGGKGGGGGTGATGELVNGSFETNSTAGWTVDPASALQNPPRYAYVQPPQGTGTVPDGNYQFSTWHMEDEFTVDLHQTIKGLKDGTYVFKGYFNLDTGLVVNIYAKDCGGEDPEPVSVLAAGAAAWSPVLVEGIEVKGGSCTVGVQIESTPPHWLNADFFTFELDPNAPNGAGGAGGANGAGGEN